jgi:hypothetical protein
MNLSALERASDIEVEAWIKKNIPELSPYQKEHIRDREMVRSSPFYFYKRKKKEKVSILWRFTIIAVPVYILLLYLSLPIKMIITGSWGYGRNFIDKFHRV